MKFIKFKASKEQDGGFYAKAENLPIVTQGEDYEDLCNNIKEAIMCYFEGEEHAPSETVNFDVTLNDFCTI